MPREKSRQRSRDAGKPREGAPRSGRSYPFPFVGAGEASYFEWITLRVVFERRPTRAELAAIVEASPELLRGGARLEGSTLRIFAGAEWTDAPEDHPIRRLSSKQLERLNASIERWLEQAHARCPVLLSCRPEDAEAEGTRLSTWHTWSVEEIAREPARFAPAFENRETADLLARFGLRSTARSRAGGKRRPSSRRPARETPTPTPTPTPTRPQNYWEDTLEGLLAFARSLKLRGMEQLTREELLNRIDRKLMS